MLFNSYEFIFLFLPITLLVYLGIGKYGSRRIALVWLIAASLYFYAWWNPAYLGLILGSMFFNYSVGLALTKKDSVSFKRYVLIAGIVANLSLLAYYKYANFFVDNINRVLSVDWNLGNIILPLAISFFTFQQITYLVDAYRGETKEYNFLHYALFVTFFPQLIAGPIVHHREMMPQFANRDFGRINYSYIGIGLSIFFLGLFKKVVIADSLSPYVAETFSSVSSGTLLSFFVAWKGVLAYTFQLYFDFSGYSDMAIGLAFLFGISLPLNFNSPYKATSIIEFWQRWHITLSRFLKDYLYIPMGGNRKGEPRRYLNLMITMLLGGLWHGAGWTFIVWGGLHGIYLVLNHAWRRIKAGFDITTGNNILVRSTSRMVTFIAIAVAWVYFRADSLESANVMVRSLTGQGGVIWPEEAIGQLGYLADVFASWGMRFQYVNHFNGFENLFGMMFMLMVVWFLPNLQQLFYRYPAVLCSPESSRILWQPDRKWLFITIVAAVISILKLGQVSEFLYFQF
ncbi:MAG: MBOAT family protein [Gammaproteobacteria bacterium]|jgi:D-alanyl-lipoteichoic acid acyltransferase DltB (MBOAT superfamily)|nr:MBOAT family protein [Gammaproteobacteria bacterium]